MRKLIVNNFVTVDGCYEGKDKSINSLFLASGKAQGISLPVTESIARSRESKMDLPSTGPLRTVFDSFRRLGLDE